MSEDTGKSKKVPKLRFPGFTDDWEQRRLGEIGKILTGNTPSTRKKEYWADKEGYAWVTPSDIEESVIDRGEKSLTEEGWKVARVVPKNSVLVTCIASIGKNAVTTVPLAFNQQINAIVPFADNDAYFLLAEIDIKEKLLYSLAGKTATPIINKKVFSDFKIFIANIDEQQKIGQFFESLDHHITFQQRKLDRLKERKKALLQKMFPKEGTNVPELRFPGFTDAWEQRRLGEVIEGLYNGQTPSRFNKDNWNGSINWLSSGELNRSIVVKTVEKISSKGKSVANLKVIPKGTVVIAITGLEAAGTRGNCAKLGIDTTLNQSCMAIFPKREILDSDYLFHWYKKIGESYGIRYTQGTKQQSYNAEIIKILPITLPKIEEQQVIARFLDDVDHQITVQQRKLDHLKLRKKALLQQMFV